jgi:hypothetical protein
MNLEFDQWWFHNHLTYEPNPGDILEFPAGGSTTVEVTCDKGATSYWPTHPHGNSGDPANPNTICPGSPSTEWHANNISDVAGSAFAVAYKSDFKAVNKEDFVVFSVNTTSPWVRYTAYQVPKRMPPCPQGGCICAWFWIHEPDSGSAQSWFSFYLLWKGVKSTNRYVVYMNGYRCNFTNTISTVPLAKPQVPRRYVVVLSILSSSCDTHSLSSFPNFTVVALQRLGA